MFGFQWNVKASHVGLNAVSEAFLPQREVHLQEAWMFLSLKEIRIIDSGNLQRLLDSYFV